MSLGFCLQTGVTALNSFSNGLEVIGNNVSNVNTTGYKKGRVEYADTFYNMLQNEGRTMQVGGGSKVDDIATQFDTEDASYTGVEGDLAINGQGFFKVVDPDSGTAYYTRDGSFRRDDEGYLVDSNGYRLQGSAGDLQVPDTIDDQTVSSWSFSSTTGKLSAYLPDGTEKSLGQVQLSSFQNPQALTSQGGNYFRPSADSGAASDFLPANDALASVSSQYLEGSNVDLTDELTDMIVTQRAFQAGSRIITTSDSLMEEAIRLKS